MKYLLCMEVAVKETDMDLAKLAVSCMKHMRVKAII